MDTQEELLTELAWLRRVAAGLVGDEASVADLTQEVALEVLRRPPAVAGEPLEGARLRGWLWTLARRKAGRERERVATRSRAEEDASQPESGEGFGQSAQQLALHRDLLAEIHALGAAEADLIVQRYLDQKPPREIAGAMGLAVPTVRKRLSRAMERLRARLVESERGPEGWSLGLCVILRGRPAPAPVPAGRGVAVLRTAGSVSAWKIVALVVGFAVLGAAWIVLDRRTAGAPPAVSVVAGLAVMEADEPALARVLTPSPGAEIDARIAVGTPAVELLSASTETTEMAARSAVRIVDEAGHPIPGARAMWGDEDSTPNALELDDSGVALLPAGARGWIYAGADGFENGDYRIEWSGAQDMRVELQRQRRIPGRILIDGVAPGRELTLWQSRVSNHWPLQIHRDERMKAALVEHGLEWARTSITTDADGRFTFTTLAKWPDYQLHFPLNLRLLAAKGVPGFGPGDRSFYFDRDIDELRVEATLVEVVEGRAIWSDDRSPVTGELSIFPCDEEGNWLTNMKVVADGTGRFQVPVSVRNSYGTDEQVTWTRLELHLGKIEVQRVLEPNGNGGSLGTFELPRGPLAYFRVMGRSRNDLVPLQAVISGGMEPCATRSDGSVNMRVGAGETLRILAPGYRYREVTVMPWAVHSDTPQVIELEPGPRLRVRFALGNRTGLDPTKSVHVVLRTPLSSFTGVGSTEDEHDHYWSLYRRLCGDQFRYFRADDEQDRAGRGSAHFQGLPNRDLWIEGLQPGSHVMVELQDVLGEVLDSSPVTMPVPGETPVRSIEFDDPYKHDAAMLVATCRWPSSGRPYQGQVKFYRSAGTGIQNIPASDMGEFSLGPLMPGRYFFVAGNLGRTPRHGEGVEVLLVPGMNRLNINAIGPEPE